MMKRAMRCAMMPALLALMGCSTEFRGEASPLCQTIDDCPDGFACSPNNNCVSAQTQPPLKYVAVDIAEGSSAFRVEVRGCDAEVENNDASGLPVLVVKRGQLSQTLNLFVVSEPFQVDAAPEDIPWLPSQLRLDQVSRLGRTTTQRTGEHPVPTGEDQPPTFSQFRWPRYHPDNPDLPATLREEGFIVWRISPTSVEDQEPLAARYHMLVPPVTAEDAATCSRDADCCDPLDADCCQPGNSECTTEDDNTCVQRLGTCRPEVDPAIDYVYAYEANLSRQVDGRVRKVNISTAPPQIEDALESRVDFVHADSAQGERLGIPALAVPVPEDRDPKCSNDSHCIPDTQFCNTQTQQCELSLAGREAWTGSTVRAEDTEPSGSIGDFEASVFIYRATEANVPVDRSFRVTASPDSETGLPTVNAQADITFDPDRPDPPRANLSQAVCVPDWGEPRSVSFDVSGEPLELLSGNGLTFRCCGLGCLPATRSDWEEGAQEGFEAEQCTGQSVEGVRIGLEATVTLTPEQLQWWMAEDSPCLPPVLDPQTGSAGRLRIDTSCDSELDESRCDVAGVAPGTADGPRLYDVRVSAPGNALLGSRDMVVEVPEFDDGLAIPIALPRRRLIRGVVELDDSLCTNAEDCGAEGAVVLAERLTGQSETTENTPGPYFYEVSTFYDPVADRSGAFVLPVEDGGVYVVTALPGPGTPGGPARRFVLVDTERAPVGDIDLGTIELEPGILVTLDLQPFDRRSTVTPLDGGSWTFDNSVAINPRTGQPIALSDPDECLSETDSACQIRKLIAGTSFPASQVRTVGFLVRDLGDAARNQARICFE